MNRILHLQKTSVSTDAAEAASFSTNDSTFSWFCSSCSDFGCITITANS